MWAGCHVTQIIITVRSDKWQNLYLWFNSKLFLGLRIESCEYELKDCVIPGNVMVINILWWLFPVTIKHTNRNYVVLEYFQELSLHTAVACCHRNVCNKMEGQVLFLWGCRLPYLRQSEITQHVSSFRWEGGVISLLLPSCAVPFIRYRMFLNAVLTTAFFATALNFKIS